MGQHSERLERVVQVARGGGQTRGWVAQNARIVSENLTGYVDDVHTVRKTEGITGPIGEASRKKLLEIATLLDAEAAKILSIQKAAGAGNVAFNEAALASEDLPGFDITPEQQSAIDTAVTTGAAVVAGPWGAIAADKAMDFFFGLNESARDEKAQQILAEMDTKMEAARTELDSLPSEVRPGHVPPPPEPDPDDIAGPGSTGSLTGGDVGGGTAGAGGAPIGGAGIRPLDPVRPEIRISEPVPPPTPTEIGPWEPPRGTVYTPDPEVYTPGGHEGYDPDGGLAIDGDVTGIHSPGGLIAGGPGGVGTGVGGFGPGAGLVGGIAGGAALGAGALAARRLAAGGGIPGLAGGGALGGVNGTGAAGRAGRGGLGGVGAGGLRGAGAGGLGGVAGMTGAGGTGAGTGASGAGSAGAAAAAGSRGGAGGVGMMGGAAGAAGGTDKKKRRRGSELFAFEVDDEEQLEDLGAAGSSGGRAASGEQDQADWV